MSETPLQPTQRTEHVQRARSAIMSKAWYGLDINSGAFNWKNSLSNISSTLNLPDEAVERAIADAFTPACLSNVTLEDKDGGRRQEPLVKVLRDEGVDTYIWTVGDPAWQRTKFERTGTDRYIDDHHYRCCESNKQDTLRQVLDELAQSDATAQARRVIVVDDKPSNLGEAMKLNDEYMRKGIIVANYHMKLHDPQANPTAFHRWLRGEIARVPHEKITVALDFDGVTADTDGVLFGPAAENIADLYEKGT